MEAGNLNITMREVFRGIVLLIAAGATIGTAIWAAAIWKTSIENRLDRMEQHMNEQDQKLLWLMENIHRQYVIPQDEKPKPKTQNFRHPLLGTRKLNDAANSAAYMAAQR